MRRDTITAWLPIVTLPSAVVLLTPDDLPRWGFMWLFAWTIFAGCKWLTWFTTQGVASVRLHVGYFTAWPGLDADTFLYTPTSRLSSLPAWLFALSKLAIGVTLIVAVFPKVPTEHELLRGLVGMIGILFVLHFGIFHLLALAWQAAGVSARPIMHWPVLATNLSEFWGKRWNLAFRDLTHRFLFRPLTARLGARTALVVGFAFSGILHELVISMPAGGGWGGPTAFFVLQVGAIFTERSPLGQRLGLGHGARGWVFTMLALLGPLVLLFHPPFLREIVVPFLDRVNHALDITRFL